MQKTRVTKNGHSHGSPRQMFTKATLRALHKAQDRGAQALETTEEAVRLHPAAALGLAFAGGIAVALIFTFIGRRAED